MELCPAFPLTELFSPQIVNFVIFQLLPNQQNTCEKELPAGHKSITASTESELSWASWSFHSFLAKLWWSTDLLEVSSPVAFSSPCQHWLWYHLLFSVHRFWNVKPSFHLIPCPLHLPPVSSHLTQSECSWGLGQTWLCTASSMMESWFFIEFPHWLDKFHSLCYVGGQPRTGIPRYFGSWVNVLSCKWPATVPFKFGMRMVYDHTVSWACCESLTCTLLTAGGLQSMVRNANEMI